MTAVQDVSARLSFTAEVAEGFFLARLEAPAVATQAVPGQFVSLKVSPGTAPLLRIPLSILSADPATGVFEVLYERLGPKSAALSRLPTGASVPCLGPLGNGFPEPLPGSRPILVGGGVGIPPLLYLGRRWRAAGQGQCLLLAGARTAAKHLPPTMLADGADAVRQATDDGTLGHAGLVTDLLETCLAEEPACTVYTCGPHPMMAAVAARCAAAGVTCYASLEEYMACGFGVCVGCVVELAEPRDHSPYGKYGRVCVDGPIFEASQIAW